jgi:hypothetical protein
MQAQVGIDTRAISISRYLESRSSHGGWLAIETSPKKPPPSLLTPVCGPHVY